MGIHKQSVSFTDAAFAYAKDLVDQGHYPNVSAAVSGELARARESREQEQAHLRAEISRRLALPLDQWQPVGNVDALTSHALARINEIEAQSDIAKR